MKQIKKLAVLFSLTTAAGASFAQAPIREKKAVTAAHPTPAQTPKVASPKSAEKIPVKNKAAAGEGLGDDLPDVDESDFSASRLTRKGQSSLLFVGGISFLNQTESAPRPVYGLEYFYRFRHNLSFGGSALYSGEHHKSLGEEYRMNVAFLGIQALYDLPEMFLTGLYIGPAFYLMHIDYLSRVSVGGTESRSSATGIALGPKVGFKFSLSNSLSSQIEGSVLYAPAVKVVGSFITVSFSTGICWNF